MSAKRRHVKEWMLTTLYKGEDEPGKGEGVNDDYYCESRVIFILRKSNSKIGVKNP